MGMNFFPSRHRHCSGCLERKIKVGKEEVIEYYHRGVVCHLIGLDLAIPLDVEPIRPGEGEVIAAKRLAERVFGNYSRFFEAVVADALYMEGPFFNFCLDRGKHIIAVLKGNNKSLLEDAQGLFSDTEPKIWQSQHCSIQYWHAEGFKAEGIDVPLRVLHTEETHHKRQRIAGQWVEKTETQSWWWATTIPERQLSTPQLWQAGHKRWDIENGNFNTLGRDWSLDHCFKHDPIAITNFVLTLFITFVLVQSFYYRNLKPQMRALFGTLISIADELYASLYQNSFHTSSAECLANPPPQSG
jgi:hypothetical protein